MTMRWIALASCISFLSQAAIGQPPAKRNPPKGIRPTLMAQIAYSGGWGPAAEFSPNGKHVLTGARTSALLWDVESGKQIRVFRHAGPVLCAAFSPDGNRILTSGRDTKVWDVNSGNLLFAVAGNAPAVFSADGKLVVTARTCTQDGKATGLSVWDSSGGKLVRTLRSNTDVAILVVSADGRHVIAGDFENTAHMWDIADGKETRQISGRRR